MFKKRLKNSGAEGIVKGMNKLVEAANEAEVAERGEIGKRRPEKREKRIK